MHNLRISSRVWTGIRVLSVFVKVGGLSLQKWMVQNGCRPCEKQDCSLQLYNEFTHIMNVVVNLCIVSPAIRNLPLLS